MSGGIGGEEEIVILNYLVHTNIRSICGKFTLVVRSLRCKFTKYD